MKVALWLLAAYLIVGLIFAGGCVMIRAREGLKSRPFVLFWIVTLWFPTMLSITWELVRDSRSTEKYDRDGGVVSHW